MKINMINSNSITINGKEYVGRNVVINNGNVTIDGVKQNKDESQVINIEITGDVESVENEYGHVKANKVGSIQTKSGDINCNDVLGSVTTMSGDVLCDAIGGSVSTMSGDITTKG